MAETTEAGYPIYQDFWEARGVDPLEQLKRHEGYKPYPYRDSRGFWTIGYGTKIHDDPRITEEAARTIANHRYGLTDDMDEDAREMQLRGEMVHDYAVVGRKVLAESLQRGIELNEVQLKVLTNMAYNMGLENLKGFKKMWRHLKKGRVNEAAYEIINSEYATQVRDRAMEMYSMMKHSKAPEDGYIARVDEGAEGAETEV